MVVVGRHDVGTVLFSVQGLALQLFWESNLCPSESGHLASNRCAIASRDKTLVFPEVDMAPKATPNIYRVVFLTGLPDFQYQNEKTCSANEELFYIENFVKN